MTIKIYHKTQAQIIRDLSRENDIKYRGDGVQPIRLGLQRPRRSFKRRIRVLIPEHSICLLC